VCGSKSKSEPRMCGCIQLGRPLSGLSSSLSDTILFIRGQCARGEPELIVAPGCKPICFVHSAASACYGRGQVCETLHCLVSSVVLSFR